MVNYLIKHIGDIAIEATTPAMIKDYLAWRIETTSKSAAAKDIAHIKSVAKDMEYRIESIPFERIKKPKHKKKERQPIPPEDISKHLEALDKWLYTITLFICLTGCRQQDAAKLKKNDIKNNIAKLTVKGGDIVEYQLDKILLSVIELAERTKEENGLKSEWIFVNRRGNKWIDTHLAQSIRKAWNAIGSCASLHCLRHTFATVATQHFPLAMAQAGLAHKSIAATANYSHTHKNSVNRAKVGKKVREELFVFIGDAVKNAVRYGTAGKKKEKEGKERILQRVRG